MQSQGLAHRGSFKDQPWGWLPCFAGEQAETALQAQAFLTENSDPGSLRDENEGPECCQEASGEEVPVETARGRGACICQARGSINGFCCASSEFPQSGSKNRNASDIGGAAFWGTFLSWNP